MSLDPERALQAAVFARLQGEPTLIPLLGSPPRVHDQPPPEPVYPYLAFGRSETRPFGGSDDAVLREGAEIALGLTCVSRFGGMEEARAVVGAVRATLHEAPLTLTDHRLVGLRVAYVDVFRAADFQVVLGVMRLRAVTEPL